MIKRLSFMMVMMLFVILLMSGCASQTGKKDFQDTIYKIEQALLEDDISELQRQLVELKEVYNKNDWKIHLLGDEGEYERLNEAINRIAAAASIEELSDVQLELATLKTIVKDIYSL